jgi:sugar diacid utilization regulator
LEQNNFSLTRTSERLKMTRHALRYRMQKLNMKIAGENGETVAPGHND